MRARLRIYLCAGTLSILYVHRFEPHQSEMQLFHVCPVKLEAKSEAVVATAAAVAASTTL